jgi:hypothetical protein
VRFIGAALLAKRLTKARRQTSALRPAARHRAGAGSWPAARLSPHFNPSAVTVPDRPGVGWSSQDNGRPAR